MVGADKRKKVMRGLECCSQQRGGPELCEQCPYFNEPFPCSNTLLHDVLDLLREQEPRVLSKSEAEQYVTHGITDGYSETPPLYVEYQKPQRYYLKWVTLETAYSWMTDYGTSSVYGSELRFWTSRPSEQQMRDTKWEGEKDE